MNGITPAIFVTPGLALAIALAPTRGELPANCAAPPVQMPLERYGYSSGFEPLRSSPSRTFLSRTAAGFVLALPNGVLTIEPFGAKDNVRIELLNAEPTPAVPEESTGYLANYFLSTDSTTWRRNVPRYAAIRYVNAYPGIDMIWRSAGSRVQFELVVGPGTDPARFGLRIVGTSPPYVDTCGDLVTRTSWGELRQTRPKAYQLTRPGDTTWVTANWHVNLDGTVRISLAQFDSSQVLLVDPTVKFSTYLGGAREDRARSVALDGAGNIYVVGHTASVNFLTRTPVQASLVGTEYDVFVTKFTAVGIPVFSTYLGGQGSDEAQGVAVDAAGSVVVVGSTNGTDFPTTVGAYRTTSGGNTEGFVFKLAATGSALTFSSYVGGSGNDALQAVTLDPAGNVYAAGATLSSNFPTLNAVQPTYAGNGDAVVLKLSASGSALFFSTFFGGSGEDQAYGVALGPSGDVYVVGQTTSADLPIIGALQGTLRGTRDAFVMRVDKSGMPVRFATYYGGSNVDFATGIRVDGSERAVVAGYTTSSDLPTRLPLQASHGGGTDAFLLRLTTSGAALDFATFLGGAGDDFGEAVALDALGGVVVSGHTASSNFPVHNAIQTALHGPRDAFVARLEPSSSVWTYATYFGGSAEDFATAVAATPTTSGAVIVGYTQSADLPLNAAFQTTFGGIDDAFVARIDLDPAPSQQASGYEYVGKLVCGPQADSLSQAVVRGFYATAVNVRNPGSSVVKLRKRVIWTLPPGNEKQISPQGIAVDTLGAGQGLATDCSEILKRTGSTNTFHEGLLIVTSDAPLDVIGVYTTASLVRAAGSWIAGNVSSIELDHFAVRRLPS